MSASTTFPASPQNTRRPSFPTSPYAYTQPHQPPQPQPQTQYQSQQQQQHHHYSQPPPVRNAPSNAPQHHHTLSNEYYTYSQPHEHRPPPRSRQSESNAIHVTNLEPSLAVPTSFDQIVPDSAQPTSGHSRRPSSFNNSKGDAIKRLVTPRLRQSASFAGGPASGVSMDNITPPRGDSDDSTGRQRLSGEPIMLGVRARKKSGFSKFMNSMLGSPKFTIGAPENPVHLTHVGVDKTGQYTVRVTLYRSAIRTDSRHLFIVPYADMKRSRVYRRNGSGLSPPRVFQKKSNKNTLKRSQKLSTSSKTLLKANRMISSTINSTMLARQKCCRLSEPRQDTTVINPPSQARSWGQWHRCLVLRRAHCFLRTMKVASKTLALLHQFPRFL